jgi:hypothetical protein
MRGKKQIVLLPMSNEIRPSIFHRSHNIYTQQPNRFFAVHCSTTTMFMQRQAVLMRGGLARRMMLSTAASESTTLSSSPPPSPTPIIVDKKLRVVVAVGGNALQRRGERLTIENMLKASAEFAPTMAALSKKHELGTKTYQMLF